MQACLQNCMLLGGITENISDDKSFVSCDIMSLHRGLSVALVLSRWTQLDVIWQKHSRRSKQQRARHGVSVPQQREKIWIWSLNSRSKFACNPMTSQTRREMHCIANFKMPNVIFTPRALRS